MNHSVSDVNQMCFCCQICLSASISAPPAGRAVQSLEELQWWGTAWPWLKKHLETSENLLAASKAQSQICLKLESACSHIFTNIISRCREYKLLLGAVASKGIQRIGETHEIKEIYWKPAIDWLIGWLVGWLRRDQINECIYVAWSMHEQSNEQVSVSDWAKYRILKCVVLLASTYGATGWNNECC